MTPRHPVAAPFGLALTPARALFFNCIFEGHCRSREPDKEGRQGRGGNRLADGDTLGRRGQEGIGVISWKMVEFRGKLN